MSYQKKELPAGLQQFSLEGKVALVTGAGGGLGSEVAKGFARSGATVVLLDSKFESVAVLRDELKAEGCLVDALACDVTDKKQAFDAVEYTVNTYGSIDIMANIAGMTRRMPLETFDEDAFDLVIDVNLKGTFYFMKYAGAKMLEQENGGSIINFGSLGTTVAIPESAAYCASKGGVGMLTKTAAVEWAERKVRVNAICPGTFTTPLLQYCIDNNPSYGDEILKRFPIKRFGRPDELVGACVYLASDASTYTTGLFFSVDGGCTAF